MHIGIRRTLGIIAIAGAALGVTAALPYLVASNRTLLTFVLLLFIGLYTWGAWCGVLLLENKPNAIKHNKIFWALQIPYFMSPYFGYQFASGIYFRIYGEK